ncbi:hypothetical protein PM082_018585 [Marasmius tenuissimus]|nr:hypothetical protein PM082_018585 [Marasmius tenuissimus]
MTTKMMQRKLEKLVVDVPEVGTAVFRLAEEATRLKKLKWKFEEQSLGMLCSNHPCDRNERRWRVGKRVRWKQCSACRTAFYRSKKCQAKDWELHRLPCAEKQRPSYGHSYRISNYDETFIQWLFVQESHKSGAKNQLKSIYTQSLARSEPIIAQFDFRERDSENPVKITEVPYEDLVRPLQKHTPCGHGHPECCDIEKHSCCEDTKDELIQKKTMWDRNTEVICRVVYPGAQCHSSWVTLKR